MHFVRDAAQALWFYFKKSQLIGAIDSAHD